MKRISILLMLLMTMVLTMACTSKDDTQVNAQVNEVAVEENKVDEEAEESVEVAELVTLRFGMMPSDSSAPIVVAKKLGYFEEVGIDADISLFFSAKDRDSALLSGNLDGADYDLITAITSISNGSEFKVAYRSNGDFKLVSPSVDMADLANKSVGISENTIIEYYVDKIMTSNGVDLSEVKKEIIPQIPVRLQMLEADKLDMALLPDPLATLSTVKGAKVLDNSSNYGENIGAFIFTDEFTANNSEAVKNFALAYDKAAKFIDENSNDKYIDYLISDLGFPEPVRDTLELVEYGQLKVHEEETFNEVVEWLNSKELLEKQVTYDEIMLK